MKKIFCIDDNGLDVAKLERFLREQGISWAECVSDDTVRKNPLQYTEPACLDLIENAPIGFIRSTVDGKIISANPAVARMLKYASTGEMISLVNRTGIAAAVYVDSAHRREVVESVLSLGGWRIFEERFRCKDGSVITCNFQLRAYGLESGSVELQGFVEDITERKLVEESLLLNQLIIDQTSLGIFRGSSDARILSANKYWAEVLGYTVEELCSMSFFDIDPNLTQELWEEHRSKLTVNGTNTFESVHRRKDGTTFPVEVTVNYYTYGDQVFSCSFAKDITRRKKADQALRQAQLIVESSPAVLFRWRAAAGWPVEMVSGNVAQFGYAPEEMLSGSVPFSSIIYHEDLARVFAEVVDYTGTGADQFQQEYRIVTKDGDVRWIDDRTVVERDAEGIVTHYQGVVLDITDRKRTECVIAARMRLLQFSAVHTLDELLEATLNEVEELTGSRIGFYHYLEPDQETLRLQNWSTRTKNEYCVALGKGLHYNVSEAGVWVDCIRERRPVIHNDYAALPHRKGVPQGHPPVIRELVVPVFRGEKIVAILGVGNKQRDYTTPDVEMVSLLAELAWEIVERKRAEEALKISERKYRTIIEHAPFGISCSTFDGKLISANPAMAGILKYDSPEELLETVNRSSIQKVLFVEPSDRVQVVNRIFEGSSWHVFDCRYRCKDGTVITCKVHSRRIVDQEGCEREFESFLENITDRLEAEKALRESEEKFRVLAETAPAAIVVYQDEKIVYVNPAAVRLFGYGEAELLRMKFWKWAHPETHTQIMDRGMARQRGEPVPIQYEHRFVKKKGEIGWVMVAAGCITYRGKPAGIATFIDITENKRSEERMQSALAEKVVLLKEVHHRVKNNLQIISSLLELQSDAIEADASRKFIRESQDRIRSMAIVHEQLYKSEDLAVIDFARYVEELVSSLYRSAVRSADKIATDIEIRHIELGIDQAIPCGLIINELVSNALKHAFPANRGGTVSIRGNLDADGHVCLSVSDNGVGLPQGFDIATTESLGLQIVTLLTKQLHGTLEIQGENGLAVFIRFKSIRRQ
ncbi:MAG: PAS domain S-box protein [Deltaproteobacteria bacterium]|nr:PAS domain S-box protein [Deltaproteobacteria bacterium]TLN01551.1 MAG: PAS domain S-box protein [bacterium]